MDVAESDTDFANPDSGNDTFWEAQARTRWGHYISSIEARAILIAHAAVPEPDILLDVGADGGRWSQMLNRYGWEAICTDVNESSLELCQSRIPRATCILVHPDEQELPAKDCSISLVLCIEVPEMMQNPLFLQEVSRVLRPSGVLVGVFFNKGSARGFFKSLCHRLRGRSGVDYYRSYYHTWRQQLSRRGFHILHEEGMCWLPFTRTSDSPLVGTAVLLEKWLGLHRLPRLSPWIAFVAQRRNADSL